LTIAHPSLTYKLADKNEHSLPHVKASSRQTTELPYRAAAPLAMFVVAEIPAKFVIGGGGW
jgi:hypothetical protein